MAKEKFDFVQPIKDIPLALGELKNFKHIIKDPVNTAKEADERKRKIYPLIYLCVGIGVIFGILGGVIPGIGWILETLGIVFIFGALFFGFLLRVLNKAKEKFADLECPKCKKQIAYDDNVSIKVLSKDFVVTKKSQTINDSNGVHQSATITAKGREKTVLEISCKCQECGTQKTFTHEFVTAEWEKSLVKVPYVQSGALLVQIEQEVREQGEKGFEGLEPRRPKGGLKVSSGQLEITYLQTPEQLVKGYFGNELQMRI